MVKNLPPLMEGGGGRRRRGGMGALPSNAIPLGEPEPELAEMLAVGLDFDKADDDDDFAAELAENQASPLPSPHAGIVKESVLDFSES